MRAVEHHAPSAEADIAAIVADAAAHRRPVEVCGNRTKRAIGRPSETSARLSTRGLSGITLYEPNELVIAAWAGTPLAEIEAALAGNGQELAFEPADWGHAATPGPGVATIGGVVAAGTSGPRRVVAGAVRDAVIGVRLVNGVGERLRFGGRVMKNVTGLDMSRLMAGAWGTLGVLTEVTLKVQPRAEDVRTLLLLGLSDEAAVSALCLALGSPAGVTATLHAQPAIVSRLAPPDVARLDTSVTALRIEGFAAMLPHRIEKLHRALKAFGEVYELDRERSLALWDDVRAMNFAVGDWPLWRLSVAPHKAAAAVAAVTRLMECRATYEWSGGLVWLEVPPTTDANATELRRVIADFDVDAMLIRADAATRGSVDVLQPMAEPLMHLTRRLKAAFDPAGILNPSRLYAGV